MTTTKYHIAKTGFFKIVFSIIFLLATLQNVNAQEPSDPSEDPDLEDEYPDPDPVIPIDGGVSFLLAAGAVAGARKLYQERKKKQEGMDA